MKSDESFSAASRKIGSLSRKWSKLKPSPMRKGTRLVLLFPALSALAVSSDPEHKFDLAVKLSKLDVATEILQESFDAKEAGGDLQHKWKQIGDLALAAGQYELAEKAAGQAGDLAGLLLMHSSSGNAAGIVRSDIGETIILKRE